MTLSNPYVGPEPIAADRRLYGRDMEIADIRDLLIAERIVLLYSPSGAGKTSLIQAGLLRELREQEGFRVLLVRGFRSGMANGRRNRYLASVLEALHNALSPALRVNDMVTNDTPLDAYLKRRPKDPQEGHSSTSEQVLIFDQFEEVLTLDPFDRDAKTEFFRELGNLLKDRSCWALFSMREDHVVELDNYLHLLPTALKKRYRLGLLERPQALAAIVRPALELDVHYEKDAAELLADDLRKVRRQTTAGVVEEPVGHYVEPVHLQVACLRLWELRFPESFQPPATIATEHVKAISVDLALEDFYADKVRAAASAARVPERDVREWIEEQLITPRGIRGQVLWEPEKSGGLANHAIEVLGDAHVVRLEARGERKWYELTHDRLIRPVIESNRPWMQKNLALLQLRAREWLRSSRSDAQFLSLPEWYRAWRWSQTHAGELRPEEGELLRRSLRHNMQTLGLVGLTVMVVIVLLAFGLIQRHYRSEIELSQKRTDVLKRLAEATVSSFRRSMSHALIDAANAAKDYELLADKGVAGHLEFTARTTLLAVLRSAVDLRRVLVPESENALLRAVAFHPTDQNALLAYAGTGGKIFLTGLNQEFARTLNACSNTVYALAFNPAGSLLAAGCEDGTVTVWTTSDWSKREPWPAHKGRVWRVVFSRDGTKVVSGGYDTQIRLRQLQPDGAAGEFIELNAKPGGGVWSMAFSPTEDKFIAGDGHSKLWLCEATPSPTCTDVDTRETGEEPQDAALAIAFSPDGSHIVTGHWSGKLLLWDNKLSSRTGLADHPNPVFSVAFVTRDDRPSVIYAADGRLRTLALPPEKHVFQRSPVAGEDIHALAFHQETGLLAAAALGGYVAVVDPIRRDRVTTRLSIETAQSEAPPATTQVSRVRRRGAVVDQDTAMIHLVVSRRDELLLVTIPKDSPAQAKVLSAIAAQQGQIIRVAASVAKKRVVSLGVHTAANSRSFSVRLWNYTDTLVPVHTLQLSSASDFGELAPRRIALSPDGELLVCAFEKSMDQSARLLLVDLKKGEKTWEEIGLKFVRELVFSEDGVLLATGGEPLGASSNADGDRVVVWKVGGSPLRLQRAQEMHLTRMANKAYELAFTRDRTGKSLVLAGGEQGQINVWDVESGELRHELRADSNPIDLIASDSGKQLVAAADNRGKITLWDTWDRDRWKSESITERNEPMQKIGFLSFLARGSLLVSGADELTLWDLDVTSLRRKVCDILEEKPPKSSGCDAQK